MEDDDPSIDADPGLILDKIDQWVDGFFALLPNLAVAGVVFLLVLLVALAVAWSVRRSFRNRGEDLARLLGSIAKWAIILGGALLALAIVVPSIRPGDLFAGLGLGSVAIGFAFKDILQNMLAGLILLIRKPFVPGDQIRCDGHEGTVEHVETRATKVRTYDGRRVVIPNTDVFTNAVTVNTAYDARRSEYDFPIPLDADWNRAVSVALEAARGVEGVVPDPNPEALAVAVEDHAKAVRVRWWTDPRQAEVVHTSSRVLLAVEAALIDADFPPPDRRRLRIAAGPP